MPRPSKGPRIELQKPSDGRHWVFEADSSRVALAAMNAIAERLKGKLRPSPGLKAKGKL
jgi:hypothetical protein